MSKRIIAASIGYDDPDQSPQGGVLYVATEGFTTGSGDTPASTHFQGRLSGNIRFNWLVAAPFTKRKPAAGFGDLVISNADGELDDALAWRFRDGEVIVKSLEPGQAWSAGTVLATTVADKIEAVGLDELKVTLRDPAAKLERPLQQESYTLTDFPDASGKLKPVAFGTPLNCTPVPVDFDALRFDCHDKELVAMADVRVDGVTVPFFEDFSDESSGFVLLEQPDGEVTCDPIATGTGNPVSFNLGSPIPSLIVSSNNGRTIQSARRSFFSPIDWNFNATISGGKSLAAGGKYYFEVRVENVATTSANYTAIYPEQLGVGFGICKDAPVEGGFINQADMYSMGTYNTTNAYTYADTTQQDAAQSIPISSSWEARTRNQVVGVLCDFDSSTVQFRVYENGLVVWNSSVLSITVNSPQDTFFPFGSVAATPATDSRSQDNQITIYTQPERFENEVPSGYEAWDDSAYDEATQFSNLVASITSRIPGLTVDTTTQGEIDALGYSYSYYCAESQPAAQILWEAVTGFTGWYYINRLGELAFGRLKAPGTVGLEFTIAEIISVRSVTTDYARGLSNRMGALRNWTVQNRGRLDDSLSESEKDLYDRRFRTELTDDTPLSDTYAAARQAEIIPTYFREPDNAQDEIRRLMGLYQDDNIFVEVDVAFDLTQFASLDLGDTVNLTLNRYNWSDENTGSGAFSSDFDSGFNIGGAGAPFIVLGISGNFASPTMRLLLWGGGGDPLPQEEQEVVCSVSAINNTDYWQFSGDIFSVTESRVGMEFTAGGAFRAFEQEDNGSGFGSQTTLATDTWHTDSPSATDGASYEVRLVTSSGTLDAGSDPADTWLSLGTTRTFYVDGDSGSQGLWEGTIEIRLTSDPTNCNTTSDTVTIDTGAPF